MFHPIFIINIQNFIEFLLEKSGKFYFMEIIHVQIISHTYYLL